MIAPGSEPVSKPTDITTSGVRSALTPKIEICETAASWTITDTKASSASRSTRRGEATRSSALTVPRCVPACGRVRI